MTDPIERDFVLRMLNNNAKHLVNIPDENKAKSILGAFIWATIGFMKHKNDPNYDDIG